MSVRSLKRASPSLGAWPPHADGRLPRGKMLGSFGFNLSQTWWFRCFLASGHLKGGGLSLTGFLGSIVTVSAHLLEATILAVAAGVYLAVQPAAVSSGHYPAL